MMNTGLSHCTVSIVESIIVRKTSDSIRGNSRLQKQIEKQQIFCNEFDLDIKTAPILKIGTENGKTFLEMPYIAGSSFVEFFATADKRILDDFYVSLCQYLDHNWNTDIEDATAAIDRKLNLLFEYSRHRDFIDFLLTKNTATFVPRGFCHGDLTLSNILFKNKEYYLIDFLDSHIETPLYDFAKLKQDLYYRWCISVERKRVDMSNSIKIAQSIDYIWKLLSNSYNNVYQSDSFRMIDALTLLRIEPYVKDRRLQNELDRAIEKLELYEEFNSTYRRQV